MFFEFFLSLFFVKFLSDLCKVSPKIRQILLRWGYELTESDLNCFKFSKHKHNDDGSNFFIGYLHDDDVIRPLYIILPQMSGYIKYFDNGGKNMSFKIEDVSVY